MTEPNDLDAMPFDSAPEPETARSLVRSDRRCVRHRWVTRTHVIGMDTYVLTNCARCGRPKDEARSRRGKSARRFGGDQERRAEKRYGWEKIGERGQMTDLRGRLMKIQQKSTRALPPALFRSVFPALDATMDGRIAGILLSYVRPGVPAQDYVVIRGADWLELHGRDEP